jgi:hypothetical protein
MASFTPDATPEEAAAAVAAIEQFTRDTATTQDTGQRAGGPLVSPWKRAALTEGVSRQPVPENAKGDKPVGIW